MILIFDSAQWRNALIPLFGDQQISATLRATDRRSLFVASLIADRATPFLRENRRQRRQCLLAHNVFDVLHATALPGPKEIARRISLLFVRNAAKVQFETKDRTRNKSCDIPVSTWDQPSTLSLFPGESEKLMMCFEPIVYRIRPRRERLDEVK